MSASEEPACGSDRHMVPSASPAICGWAKAATWAGVPNAAISRALAMVSIGKAEAEMLAAMNAAIETLAARIGSCIPPRSASKVPAISPAAAYWRTASAISGTTWTPSPSSHGSRWSAGL